MRFLMDALKHLSHPNELHFTHRTSVNFLKYDSIQYTQFTREKIMLIIKKGTGSNSHLNLELKIGATLQEAADVVKSTLCEYAALANPFPEIEYVKRKPGGECEPIIQRGPGILISESEIRIPGERQTMQIFLPDGLFLCETHYSRVVGYLPIWEGRKETGSKEYLFHGMDIFLVLMETITGITDQRLE